MRKYLLFIILAVAGSLIFFLAHSIQTKIKERKTIEADRVSLPKFQFLDLDSSIFTPEMLPQQYANVIIYFNPFCEHCQYEAKAIKTQIEAFQEANVLFVSDESINEIKDFAQEYGLLEHANIKLLKDPNYSFKSLFGSSAVPSVFIYNTEGSLVKHYQGETKVEAIIKHI